MEISTNTKPALAFAGVGWIGRSRMQAAIESGTAEIALLTDPSAECITEALKMAPGSKTVSSFEEAIADPDIDGVVIATPSALHMEQAVAAFENNKAVFCQKPLGRNASEVAAVIAAAEKADKLLGADFSYRYTAAFQQILPIISSGELGQIFAVDLKFHNAYGPDKAWFYDMKQSGGGCVLDLGIHLIDLMLYALDFPEVTALNSSLYSKGVSVKGKNEVEDYANVSLELATGTNAQLSCSWNLQAGQEAVIEASFYGTNGGVSLKNVNGSFYDFTGSRYWGTKTETLVSPPDAWGGRALTDWIQKLSVNTAFDASAAQYLPSAEVLDRIYGRS
ncbi:Gfo/Idh/MocA family protein [Dyadobacter sp. Leaf189]|uniref:Gfo/Idh/MocA family protein n=1 Tax=Dyadobacter sp. Leaf189 TaxID=1736295 RepID=UPI00070072A7|nr:Gfo/Idh/MocA family oxidoreductase [Dyadobacter sp. Leaf189]KQS28293.1 oxidoreductase [Dyadobacter sp. Leaf189]